MALKYVPAFLQSVYDDVCDDYMLSEAERYSYALPHKALRFESLADLRAHVQASGSHYFDRDTIAFFNARTHGDLASGRFWVESIKPGFTGSELASSLPLPRRQYWVSWVSKYTDPTSGHVTLSVKHLRDFDALADARMWRTRLARAVEHAESAQQRD